MPGLTELRIDWKALSDDALDGVIEEYVTREGTEYGAEEVPLERKCAQVRAQLERGEAFITWNEDTGTCSIVTI